MIVVSDAGPLIYLGGVGRLELLHALFDTITVPATVWDEVVVQGRGELGSAAVAASTWIQVAEPLPSILAARLSQTLDPGEAAAIALGVELHADLLIVDDLRGRQAAATEGLPVVGTLGLLLRAKQAGHLRLVRPVLDAILAHGFRATPSLVRGVLTLAGED